MLLGPTTAHGAFPSQVTLSEIQAEKGFKITSTDAPQFLGWFVSDLGDINGDGLADFSLSAPGDTIGSTTPGKVYVVYGQPDGFDQDVNLASADGSVVTAIAGERTEGEFGYSASGAGDINGDGIDDLVIGATEDQIPDNGTAYVIFGQAGGLGATFDVTALDGSNGFVIRGENISDRMGHSVSRAGDVNGDDIDDLIVGARVADFNGDSSGRAYVVFGKTTSFGASLDPSTLNGANGFIMDGQAVGDNLSFQVSEAGDVNGDGFDDVILSAIYHDTGANNAGRVYVVFGQGTALTSPLNLAGLNGTNGFVVDGEAADNELGLSVGSAGDVNGDGYADLYFGSYYAANGTKSGRAYVVFGKASGFGATVGLSTLDGSNGFSMDGEDENDQLSWVSTGAGDLNGDGFDEVIVGARAHVVDGAERGTIYVLFGQEDPFDASVDLTALGGSNGFIIEGGPGEAIGRHHSMVGDINNDGVDDFVLGSPYGVSELRGAYVLFGGLTGIGQTSAPQLSVTSLDLGEANFEEPGESQTVTITNNSQMALTLGQLTFTGTNSGAFELVSDTCSNQRLAAGEQCTVEVQVRSSSSGSVSAQLSIPSNSGGSPQSVALSASVLAPVRPSVPVPTLFGKTLLLLAGLLGLLGVRRLIPQHFIPRRSGDI